MSAASAFPQGFKVLPLPLTQLSLAAVLKCGQSFRWSSFPLSPSQAQEAPAHEWRFCLKDRVVCLRQSEEFLFYRFVLPNAVRPAKSESATNVKTDSERDIDTETLAFIRDYFQLDTDLLELYDTWSTSDPVFRNLRGRFQGIRILRQDPWECLISFICSSNNNISRISKMVQNLCTHFSPPLLTLADPDPLTAMPSLFNAPLEAHTTSSSTSVYHPFPPPSALSSSSVSSKLRQLGFGYRADFIQKTAAMLLEAHGSDEGVSAFLERLRKVETDKAREELMKLMGVGRKVADCVLLMSLDKREVVPVDTHVYQIAVKHYGMRGASGGKTSMTPKLYDEVNARLAKIWGPYAGWAHSILFTADLKSFSTYGLPTPSPSPSPSVSPAKPRPLRNSRTTITVVSSQDTPSSSPQKRKQAQVDKESSPKSAAESETILQKEESEVLPSGTLADRVKRRRRFTLKSDIVKEW